MGTINNPNYILGMKAYTGESYTGTANAILHCNKHGSKNHVTKLENAIHSLALQYVNSNEFKAWRSANGLSASANAHITFVKNGFMLTVEGRKNTFTISDDPSTIPTQIVEKADEIYQKCMAHQRKHAAMQNTSSLQDHTYTPITLSPQPQAHFNHASFNPPPADIEENFETKDLQPLSPELFDESIIVSASPQHAAQTENLPQHLLAMLDKPLPVINEEIQQELEALHLLLLENTTLDAKSAGKIDERIRQLQERLSASNTIVIASKSHDEQEKSDAVINLENAVEKARNQLLELVKVTTPPTSPPASPQHINNQEEISINAAINNANETIQVIEKERAKSGNRASFNIPQKYEDPIYTNKYLLNSSHSDSLLKCTTNPPKKISARAKTGIKSKVDARKNPVSTDMLLVRLKDNVKKFETILQQLPAITEQLQNVNKKRQTEAFENLLKLLCPDNNPWIAIDLLDAVYQIEATLKKNGKTISNTKKTELEDIKEKILKLQEAFNNLYKAINKPGRRGTVRN
jgi:hypothetical protein